MKWTNLVVRSVVLVPVLAACQSGGSKFGQSDVRVTQVDDLGERIEAVHVEAEIAQQRVRDTLGMLQVVASPDFKGDPVLAYSDFVEAIDASEKQAEVLHDVASPMMEAANGFFSEWSQDLESFSSAQMRNLSRSRLASTHQRYKAIVQALTPVQGLLDEINMRYRDCATFLAYDFNQASLGAIQDDVVDMTKMASKLDKRFQVLMRATSAYVESTRMPLTQQQPADEPRATR